MVGKSSGQIDRQLAYLVFRLTLGINIAVHGASRIFGPGASAFATETGAQFSKTFLSPHLVHAFLVTVPFAELILGALMTVGLLTRWVLILGGLLITALVFGTALRNDWNTVGVQMIYAIAYYLLTVNCADDAYSLDRLLRSNRSATQ